MPGQPGRYGRVGPDRRDSRTFSHVELNLACPRCFQYGRAEPAAIVEQEFVEFRALHLVAMIDRQMGIAGEAEFRRRAVGV